MDDSDYMLIGPNDVAHIIQMCTYHSCKVFDVKDPTGTGMVKVEWQGGSGKKEVMHWIPSAGGNIGSDKNGRGHSGLWCPPQPGQSGFVMFPSGEYQKPCFIAGPPWMSGKGDAGSE